MITAYRVAARYSLLVLARNRLAMVLLVGFFPLVISLVHFVVTRQAIGFRYRPTGQLLSGGGEKITLITCALTAATQLVGFAMFTAAQRASAFDQRLISAGYPRLALLLAKLTSLNVFAALVAGYATAWMRFYWPMRQVLLMSTGIYLAGLLYGAIGLFLALFLPGELEGMVTIIMATCIELALQNPITNPAANGRLVQYLPLYGAMQTCLGAGFTDTFPISQVALTLVWTVGFAAIALIAFALRTRIHTASPLPWRRQPQPA